MPISAAFSKSGLRLLNPFTMALWGLIVAGSLAIGFLLVFAGLDTLAAWPSFASKRMLAHKSKPADGFATMC